jgi:hypothetical protein
LFVLLTAVLSGCSEKPAYYFKPKELAVLYEGDGLKAIEVPRLTEKQVENLPFYTTLSYSEFTEDRLFDSSYNEFFAVGKIANIRETRIDYKEEGKAKFVYGTLFDLKVDKLFFITDIERQIVDKHTYKNNKYEQFSSGDGDDVKVAKRHKQLCDDDCSNYKDKGHSFGGLFGIGVKKTYTTAGDSGHNENRLCKHCNYIASTFKNHSYSRTTDDPLNAINHNAV